MVDLVIPVDEERTVRPAWRRKLTRRTYSLLTTRFKRIVDWIDHLPTRRREKTKTKVKKKSKMREIITKVMDFCRRMIGLRKKRRKRINFIRLVCAQVGEAKRQEEELHASASNTEFDTDSYPIKVDNCATRCMSPVKSDFIGPFKPVRVRVKGFFGDKVMNIYEATLRWHIDDDDGAQAQHDIAKSYYVKSAPTRILSPQHWAKMSGDNTARSKGTWCATYDDTIVLHWDQNTRKRVIPLDPYTNTATIFSSSGFQKASALASEIQEEYDNEEYVEVLESGITDEMECLDVGLVSDDEENPDEVESFLSEGQDKSVLSKKQDHEVLRPDGLNTPLDTDFDIEKHEQAPHVIIDEEDEPPQDASKDFLRWHHRLGHCPYGKIVWLAKQGVLPRRLADCRKPKCTSCMFGKATKRPWKTRQKKNDASKIKEATLAGQCVSIDTLISITPGLIGQLRGIPTTARYKAATIFVDHFSGLGYVYLHKSTTAAEAVEAKRTFENYATNLGVKIRHYHADNGAFAAKAF